MEYAKRVLAVGDTISDRSVIVSGAWLPYFIFATPNAKPDNEENYTLTRRMVDYIGLLSFERLQKYRQQKMKIYYITSTDKYCRDVLGLDIVKYGGEELRINKF